MRPMLEPREHLRMVMERAAGVAPKGDLKRIRALRFTEPGFDRATWREMCGKGWLAIGSREFCELAEELGADLVPEPLIPAAMAAQLLPQEHLARVMTGERIVLPAWQEQPGSLDLVGKTVLRDGKLDGQKRFIPMAAGADAFLVTVAGGLALVERDVPGVTVQHQQTEDGGHLGTLIMDNAPAEAIEGDAAEALECSIMAASAYLLGLMDRALKITLDYIKATEQSGRTGGSFQAMRRHVDACAIQVPLTRSVVAAAAAAIDRMPNSAERRAAISRAKVRASDAAMAVTRACAQLHGGLAHMDAHDISLFRRKAMVMAPLYGSPTVHRARFQTVAPERSDG
jgi:alkylation response protein AidB-like acyl-CoA dehydrogenase